MADRAVLSIDGNNWYHSFRNAGATRLGSVDYVKVSRKLVGLRDWVGTRYYVCRVPQTLNTKLYADQRRFVPDLRASDRRITVHFGRLEPRERKNEAAIELLEYLGQLATRIDKTVYSDLVELGKRHKKTTVMVEKAVDVQLAVDMVAMAQRDEYDAAYILSADGDYTPAVTLVRGLGKRVYAASPGSGAELARAVNSFIRLDVAWLGDCYHT